MIHKVGGHTLVIELIAKQIGNPVCGLSLKRAAEIVEHTGFSNIAVGSVNYQKDSTLYHNTIRQIVSQLFEAEALPELPTHNYKSFVIVWIKWCFLRLSK